MAEADLRPRWKILALYGVAGVGKSRLAREMFDLMAPGHPGQCVFLSCDPDCTDPVTLEMIALRLLTALQVADLDPEEMTERARLAVLREMLARPGNLIVIDDLAVGLDRQVLDRLLAGIGSSDSTFVVVSRAKPPGYYANQLREIRPLNAWSAGALARIRIGERLAEQHPHEFAELVRHCEGLPRALLAACGAVLSTGDLPGVANRLAADDRCLGELRTAESDTGADLAAAYLRLSDEQRRAMVAVSLLRSPDIGARNVAAVLGEDNIHAVETWLAELEDARLLTARRTVDGPPDEPRFRMGRLVRLALRESPAFRADRDRFLLNRDKLDADYRKRLHVIYKRWSEESPSEIATSAEVMALLRDDGPDILHASAVAPEQIRPSWKLAHIIAGLFPIVSCDWTMWQDFFELAQTTALPMRNRNGVALALQAIEQAVGLNLLFAGRLDQAEVRLSAGLKHARGRLNVDEDLVIRAHVHLAELEMERGRYDAAAAHITEVSAKDDPRPFDADKPWAVLVSAVVDRHVVARLWHRVELLREAQSHLVGLQDPTRRSRLSLYIGDVLRELGQYRDAEQEYLNAQKVAEDAGDHFTVARADYGRALLFLDGGRVAEARRLIRGIEHAYLATGDELWQLRHRYLALLADLAQPAADGAGRRLAAERAERLMRDLDPEKDRRLYPDVVLLRVRALLAAEDHATARRVLDEAMRRLDRDQYRWIRAHALVLSGQVHHRQGSRRPAREDLKAAVRTFAEFHDSRGEMLARRELLQTWGVLRVCHPQRFAVWRVGRRTGRAADAAFLTL